MDLNVCHHQIESSVMCLVCAAHGLTVFSVLLFNFTMCLINTLMLTTQSSKLGCGRHSKWMSSKRLLCALLQIMHLHESISCVKKFPATS